VTQQTISANPIEHIRRSLSELSPSLRKVADLVLAEPSLVEHYSAAELARQAGASQAAVTRFCQAVGLDGYHGLVLALARERGRRAGESEYNDWAQSALDSSLTVDDNLERVVALVSATDVRALQETAQSLDLGALDRAAQALVSAERIDVYGVGGSRATVGELETRLLGIGYSVRGWEEVHVATKSASLLGSADAAVGISDSGATREVYEPLATARGRGATTIALTRDPTSALARLADINLTSIGASIGFRDGPMASRHSQLLILDCLYLRVAQLAHVRASTARALTAHISRDHLVEDAQQKRLRRGKP